jgi:hypothetical protein
MPTLPPIHIHLPPVTLPGTVEPPTGITPELPGGVTTLPGEVKPPEGPQVQPGPDAGDLTKPAAPGAGDLTKPAPKPGAGDLTKPAPEPGKPEPK